MDNNVLPIDTRTIEAMRNNERPLFELSKEEVNFLFKVGIENCIRRGSDGNWIPARGEIAWSTNGIYQIVDGYDVEGDEFQEINRLVRRAYTSLSWMVKGMKWKVDEGKNEGGANYSPQLREAMEVVDELKVIVGWMDDDEEVEDEE